MLLSPTAAFSENETLDGSVLPPLKLFSPNAKFHDSLVSVVPFNVKLSSPTAVASALLPDHVPVPEKLPYPSAFMAIMVEPKLKVVPGVKLLYPTAVNGCDMNVLTEFRLRAPTRTLAAPACVLPFVSPNVCTSVAVFPVRLLFPQLVEVASPESGPQLPP